MGIQTYNLFFEVGNHFKKSLLKYFLKMDFLCSFVETKTINMSFSDLFDSGFRNRNKGHFSAIVRVALSDGIITPEEQEFLDKLAIKLEISQAEYEEILENPLKYPINPPLMHTQRIERLYDLARMVYADHILGTKQHVLLSRFALALGFTAGNITYIVDKALKLVEMNADLDTFTYEMQHMNR